MRAADISPWWINKDCPGTATAYGESEDGNEAMYMEEGRAQFNATLLSNFDWMNPQAHPGLLYPAGLTCSSVADPLHPFQFDRYKSPWLAAYVRLALTAGYGPAVMAIHGKLAEVNDLTRMVGSCGSSTVAGCPANSTYRDLLEADESGPADGQHGYEISEALHRLVTDADRATPGAQGFPWPDEVPDTLDAAVLVEPSSAEAGRLGDTYRQGAFGEPYFDARDLRFDEPLDSRAGPDRDTFKLFAVPGANYEVNIECDPSVDVYPEVYDAHGVLLVGTERCATVTDPTRCVRFHTEAGASGYYRILVEPIGAIPTSARRDYNLVVKTDPNTGFSDIHSDEPEGAYPLVVGGEQVSGYFKTVGDVDDWFRVISVGPQTLEFKLCGARANLYDVTEDGPLMTVVATFGAESCSSPFLFPTSAAVGIYLLDVMPTADAHFMYSYDVSVRGDGDAGLPWPSSGRAMIPLSGDSLRGRVYAGSFESADDEDWYTIEIADPGEFLTVETFGVGVSVDTNMEVYGPTDTVFGRRIPEKTFENLPDTYLVPTAFESPYVVHWMVDDDSGGMCPRCSRLAFVVPVAGRYYVRVRNEGVPFTPCPELPAEYWYYLAFDRTGSSKGMDVEMP